MPAAFQQLQLDLLRLATRDGTPLKWRQAQLANALLVLLAPPPAESTTQVGLSPPRNSQLSGTSGVGLHVSLGFPWVIRPSW